MPSVINALGDLFKSLVELVWSFITTTGDLVQKTLQFALNFATEMLGLVVDFFHRLVHLSGGIVSFILGNVIVLSVVASAVFGFLLYQRSQGRQVTVGNKKLN